MNRVIVDLKMILSLKKYRVHIIAWIIFIIAEFQIANGYSQDVPNILKIFPYYILNIVVFYAMAHGVFPYALKEEPKNKWKFLLRFLLVITMYISLKYLIDLLISSPGHFTSALNFEMPAYLFKMVSFILPAVGYFYMLQYLSGKQELYQLLEAQVNEKLQQAAHQKNMALYRYKTVMMHVNPHFIFGTINYVYGKIPRQDKKTMAVLVHLSDLLRYSLKNEQLLLYVPLIEELEQLTLRINVKKLTHQENIYFEINPAQNLESLSFVAMVLMPIIDKILKLGRLTDPGFITTLCLSATDEQLMIEFENLKIIHGLQEFEEELMLCRQRLKVAYGNEASLIYEIGTCTDRLVITSKINNVETELS